MAQDRDSKLIRADISHVYDQDPLVREVQIDAERSVGEEIGDEVDQYAKRSYFQHRGFYSIPRATESVPAGLLPDQIIFLKTDNTYVGIASEGDPGYKPALLFDGDTAIYSDGGTWVKVLADGTVKCQANALSIILMEPDGTITLQNQKGAVEITPAGAITIASEGPITINNVNGGINIAVDGTVNINDGNLIVDP